MHPSSLLSYYPTYALLDQVVSEKNYKKVNLFIDLKNNLQSTYMEHAIVNIVNATKQAGYYDTSIFSSLVSFLSFHRVWGMKRGIDINFFIFYEMGQSYYHKNISKTYKISRQIDDLYGLDREDRNTFYSTTHANFTLISKSLNLVPKTKVIALPNLEADFLPYYLMTRGLVEYGNGTVNLIYSNDHDLWQCVGEHSVVFSKAGKHRKLVRKGEVVKNFLKRPNNIPDIFLPFLMAIHGDTGDDVQGIPNVGPARLLQMFDELIKYSGDMKTIWNKVENGECIFDVSLDQIKNKYLKDVVRHEQENGAVSKALKLVSFELLSRAIDNPNTTEMLDKRKFIIKILEDDKIAPRESLKKALEDNNVFLEEASMDFLYI